VKVAACPAVTVTFFGWVAMLGATAAALTVRVAGLLVATPDELLTVTVNVTPLSLTVAGPVE